MSLNLATLQKLKWKKFPVLNDGFVCLVDVMGDDAAVVQAARVSYGNDKREDCPVCKGEGGFEEDSGGVNPDGSSINVWVSCPECYDKTKGLIRYLMRHRHTTPFEMAEVKLLVRVPMDCWRQWIRHRTANVNEYSTRYSEAIDSQQKTKPDEWRTQATNNKQGSGGFLPEVGSSGSTYPIGGDELSRLETEFQEHAQRLYNHRLVAGVAKEQARKDLPLSTYTEAYWKIDLHNLLHFLSLRMDSHAQLEIRQYATTIGEQIVKPLFPVVWEAFEDYRLRGMFLTRLDIEAVKIMAHYKLALAVDGDTRNIREAEQEIEKLIPNKREREECIVKLERLEIL